MRSVCTCGVAPLQVRRIRARPRCSRGRAPRGARGWRGGRAGRRRQGRRELEVLAVEVRRVEVGEADQCPARRRARRGPGRSCRENDAGERGHAPGREPVVVGEAEAALAVADDELAVGRAQLVALEAEEMPVRVRGRRRVAEAAGVLVGADGASDMRTSWVARIGPCGRSAAAHPDGPADVVGGRGETRASSRRSSAETVPAGRVGQELMRPDLRRAGVAPLLRERLARLEHGTRPLPLRENGRRGRRGRPPRARAGRRRAWSSRCRSCRPRAGSRRRRCGARRRSTRQRDDLLAPCQAHESAAVAADHVEARRSACRVLAHEGDPA